MLRYTYYFRNNSNIMSTVNNEFEIKMLGKSKQTKFSVIQMHWGGILGALGGGWILINERNASVHIEPHLNDPTLVLTFVWRSHLGHKKRTGEVLLYFVFSFSFLFSLFFFFPFCPISASMPNLHCGKMVKDNDDIFLTFLVLLKILCSFFFNFKQL